MLYPAELWAPLDESVDYFRGLRQSRMAASSLLRAKLAAVAETVACPEGAEETLADLRETADGGDGPRGAVAEGRLEQSSADEFAHVRFVLLPANAQAAVLVPLGGQQRSLYLHETHNAIDAKSSIRASAALKSCASPRL